MEYDVMKMLDTDSRMRMYKHCMIPKYKNFTETRVYLYFLDELLHNPEDKGCLRFEAMIHNAFGYYNDIVSITY